MEKIRLLLYCTKSTPMLRVAKEEFKGQKRARCYSKEETKNFTQYIEEEMYEANGKIVAECDYKIEALERIGNYIRFAGVEDGEWLNDRYYEYKSCLSEEELFNYIKDKFYAIHIKNLNIFDKAIPLTYYFKYNKQMKNILEKAKRYEHPNDNELDKIIVDKAPQNMMYVYDCNAKEEYILISIHPEWLCKILNGEKTIEIRKKVLKEMINNDK